MIQFYTHTHIYTHIHSFSDSFPTYVVTEYWVEFSVLYSRSLLVILYMKVKVSQSCLSLHVQFLVTLWTVACQVPLSLNSPGKNTGVGSHSLLQRIFLTQGLNLGLLHWRQILYHLSHQGSFVGFFCLFLFLRLFSFLTYLVFTEYCMWFHFISLCNINYTSFKIT